MEKSDRFVWTSPSGGISIVRSLGSYYVVVIGHRAPLFGPYRTIAAAIAAVRA